MTVTPTGCKEGFIFPVVDKFYETLGAVLNQAFTEKEKEQNAHIYYALPYIESLSSPAQIVPTIKMILSLKPNQTQLSILGGAFTRALKNVASDDHSFRESMMGNKATLQIINLRKAYQNKGLPDQEITDAFRSYLLKQLNGTRCSDGLKLNNQTPSDSKYLLPVYIEYANENLLTENPITAEQIDPLKVENAEDSPDYYPDLGEETLLRKYQKLRFNSEGKEVSESEKNQDEWRLGFSQLLNDIVSWQPKDNTSDRDFFHQKCAFFQSMLEIAPKEELELQENIFNQYLYFVASSQMQREHPAEWLMQAQRLLNLVAASSAKLKTRRQEAVEKTNNSTLNLYLKLIIPLKTAVR